MVSCHSQLPNFEFTREEIDKAVEEGKLLTVEIEFSLKCNFKCSYCYAPHESDLKNEMSLEEIKNAILQAKDLGARKIVVLGGEPMVYPHILHMIKFMREQDLVVEMFTNGYDITPAKAKTLLENNVQVVLKVNTFKEDLQDELAGKKGAFKVIQEALKNLQDVGYPQGESTLAVSTIICQQNFDELIDMWKWFRDRKIIPYFETITPQGNAKDNARLDVEPSRVQKFFEKISEIDKKDYGYTWTPQPPLVANKCLRHQFSCLINSKGEVMPCVGVTIPVGNVREKPLKEILKDSEVLQYLRHYKENIKGPCRRCEQLEDCYGCRGAAYQLTGDYLASDPLCWKNIDRQDEIIHLPIEVDDIIPQKFSMKVIDKLIGVSERKAETEVIVNEDMIFLNSDNALDEVAYIEMMAQSMAAMEGFKQMNGTSAETEGFLLGVKNVEVFGRAQLGDTLTISVFKYAKFGDFGIVKGTVSRGNEVLAKGDIKIWHNTEKVNTNEKTTAV